MTRATTLGAALLPVWLAAAADRHQSFDADPGWEGVNNRPTHPPLTVTQDFGYEAAGGGRIGGRVTPAGEPAFYAAAVGPFTLRDRLSASGVVTVKPGGGNVLLGFFQAGTVNEWRTPNSLVWRLNGRGETFHAHFEYATSKWRAGAGVIGRYDREADRMHPVELPAGGSASPWSLVYDPGGAGGAGTITASLGGHESVCTLNQGHQADGARFDRFGLLNVIKSVDGAGELWIGNLEVNGRRVDLATDPGWEGFQNRRKYTTDVRPWFDFGWSPTRHAGGRAAGELGGRFFRGDCREAARLACYADRLAILSLDAPLRAAGRVTLRRGVSDSTALIGFFNRKDSLRVNDSQASALPANCLGMAIEGPSSEGFFVYPVCRGPTGDGQSGQTREAPRIFPDGAAHDWTLVYDPAGAGGRGRVVVRLGEASVAMDLAEGARAAGHRFDRFGLVTPWIDGNGQTVFFDDLVYTVSQE